MANDIQNIETKISSIDKLHWLLIVAVAVLGIWIFWLLSKPKPTFEDGFRKSQIENLEQQRKVAKDSIASLNKLVVQKDSNNINLKNQYSKNETKIKTIHTIVAVKDSVINSDGVSELQQFLTDAGKNAD